MLGQFDENHRTFTPLTVTNQDQLSARAKAFVPSDLKGKKRRQAILASVGSGYLPEMHFSTITDMCSYPCAIRSPGDALLLCASWVIRSIWSCRAFYRRSRRDASSRSGITSFSCSRSILACRRRWSTTPSVSSDPGSPRTQGRSDSRISC